MDWTLSLDSRGIRRRRSRPFSLVVSWALDAGNAVFMCPLSTTFSMFTAMDRVPNRCGLNPISRLAVDWAFSSISTSRRPLCISMERWLEWWPTVSRIKWFLPFLCSIRISLWSAPNGSPFSIQQPLEMRPETTATFPCFLCVWHRLFLILVCLCLLLSFELLFVYDHCL